MLLQIIFSKQADKIFSEGFDFELCVVEKTLVSLLTFLEPNFFELVSAKNCPLSKTVVFVYLKKLIYCFCRIFQKTEAPWKKIQFDAEKGRKG